MRNPYELPKNKNGVYVSPGAAETVKKWKNIIQNGIDCIFMDTIKCKRLGNALAVVGSTTFEIYYVTE